MSEYKLVPVEPTQEMIDAARQHHEGEAYLPVSVYKAMLAAAPAVHGEPVAYLRKDQLRQVQRMGTMLGEIADSPRVDRVPVYATPQPAEQKPAPGMSGPTEALRQYQHNDGSGLVFGYDKLLMDQYVAGLVEALERVREQVDGNIRETVRDCVNGRPDVQDIYEYCDSIDAIIDTALAAHRKGDQP